MIKFLSVLNPAEIKICEESKKAPIKRTVKEMCKIKSGQIDD